MSAISSFRGTEDKHIVNRGKGSMDKFSEYAMKINNFKKKKMKLLTNEQRESYENETICDICQRNFENKYLTDEKYCKVRDNCH